MRNLPLTALRDQALATCLDRSTILTLLSAPRNFQGLILVSQGIPSAMLAPDYRGWRFDKPNELKVVLSDLTACQECKLHVMSHTVKVT